MRWLIFSVLGGLLLAPALAADKPDDPLRSVQWETMVALYLKDHPIVFDERVRVLAPESAEDSLEVPVMVDASTLESKIEKMVVFADFNPLPKVLEFYPGQAAAKIGFRFKIQQASPIRAAVLDQDGTWHVGGVWIDAAGGGCTLPSVGSSDTEWSSRLGEINAALWPRENEQQRLRFSVVHPMDTGLADGIPVFHIDTITLHDEQNRELSRLLPFEPVSENPVFSLDLPQQQRIRISGRDNNGNQFGGEVGL